MDPFTGVNLGNCKQGLECKFENGITIGHGICTKLPFSRNGGVINGSGLEGGALGLRGGSELGNIAFH